MSPLFFIYAKTASFRESNRKLTDCKVGAVASFRKTVYNDTKGDKAMLSEKLIALRREKGLSQVELAEELNVSRQAVSRWETGEAAPSLENLRCLRDLYNVSLDYLVCDGERPEQPAPPPETEPEPVAEETAAAPARSPGVLLSLALSSAALAIAVLTALLLLFRLSTPSQEPPDPLKSIDGTSMVIGEDGTPIVGEEVNIDKTMFIITEDIE